MSIETFKKIIGSTSLTDEQIEVLLERAKKLAVNHYWWKEDDEPQSDDIEKFVNRYEYEIYDVAKAMYESASRDGMVQFTELGVTRRWESGGDKAVTNALSAIPVQTYVW